MTIQEIKSNITAWITTGIPANIKSFRVRSILSNMATRIDVQEAGRLRITKPTGNESTLLELGDIVYGIIEDELVRYGIYIGGDQNLLASYVILDGPTGSGYQPNYFEYADIATMLADQGNQTAGDICYVTDASADPDITSGDATYIYLGGATTALADYRRLTDAEADAIVTGTIFDQFSVKEIVDFTGTPATDTGVNGITLNYNGTKIKEIIFDLSYSAMILSLAGEVKNYRITLFNITQSKLRKDTIDSIVVASGGYYKAVLDESIDVSDFALEDAVRVTFDQKPVWVNIEGFATKKVTGYTTPGAWEVGDRFHGWDDDTFVAGKVIALPFSTTTDLYDLAKCSLALNTEI